jgi:molybdopterin converting factor subunit 1
MRTLRVHYFAVLREQRGLAEESLSTGAATAADLYEELRARHGFTLAAEFLRAAVNEEFVPWGAALRDGDAVAFLPPVAGG